MARKESRRKQEERLNFILILLIIILLILIVIVVATKTNKGRMKEATNSIVREIKHVDEGIYYQEEKNENVYLLINKHGKDSINFDLKIGTLYKNNTINLENGKGSTTIVDEIGNFKVELDIADDFLKIKIIESDNIYFEAGEEYNFKR